MAEYYACDAFIMQLFLKILNGMANSVDPDQSAPSVIYKFV